MSEIRIYVSTDDWVQADALELTEDDEVVAWRDLFAEDVRVNAQFAQVSPGLRLSGASEDTSSDD